MILVRRKRVRPIDDDNIPESNIDNYESIIDEDGRNVVSDERDEQVRED